MKRLFGVLLVALSVLVLVLVVTKDRSIDVVYNGDEYINLITSLEVAKGNYDESELLYWNDGIRNLDEVLVKLNTTIIDELDNGIVRMKINDGLTIRDIVDNNKDDLDLLSMISQHTIYRIDEVNPVGTYDNSDYLEMLHIQDSWGISSGEGITVAVLDTGVDITHPNLEGHLSNLSYNAVTKEVGLEYVGDINGHGTSVVGTIVSEPTTEVNIIGAAPDVTVMMVKVSDEEFLYETELFEGVNYAIDNGADIINMSFSTSEYGWNPNNYTYLDELFQKAVDHNVILISSAGNEGEYGPRLPSSHHQVISVGAVDESGTMVADYSNRGEYVDVVAPGNIPVLAIGGGSKVTTGTSNSTPMISGVVALYMATHSQAGYEEIYGMLTSTTSDLGAVGRDVLYAYGLPNAYDMLTKEKVVLTCTDGTSGISKEYIYGKDTSISRVSFPVNGEYKYGGYYYDIDSLSRVTLYEDIISEDTTIYLKWNDVSSDTDNDLFLYSTIDGNISIDAYLSNEYDITIPSTIDAKLVSQIGDAAFDALDSKIIHIGDNIEVIGAYAFYGSNFVVYENLNNGVVTTIGSHSFGQNYYMEEFKVPDTVTSIPSAVVSFNIGIETYYIGRDVEVIDDFAYPETWLPAGKVNFKEYVVHPDNQFFTSLDGVLYTKDLTTLLRYPSHKTDLFFAIPKEVEMIDSMAFSLTTYLSTLYIGENVTDIELTKLKMYELSEFVVDDNNQTYTSYNGMLFDKEMTTLLAIPAFMDVSEIVLPSSVIAMHPNAINPFSFLRSYTVIEQIVFLQDELQEDVYNLHWVQGNTPPDLIPINELITIFEGYDIRVNNVYASPENITLLNNQVSSISSFYGEVKAFDSLLVREEGVLNAYHRETEFNVFVEMKSSGEKVGEFPIKKLVDIDKVTIDNSNPYLFDYFNGEFSLDTNILPVVVFVDVYDVNLRVRKLDDYTSALTNLPVPTKKGYSFVGWYKDPYLTEPYNNEVVSKSMTLYPKYEVDEFTAYFHYNDSVVSVDYKYSDEIDYTINETGKILTGWITASGENFLFSGMPDSDLDLYPVFEDLVLSNFEDYGFSFDGEYYKIVSYNGDTENLVIPSYYFDGTSTGYVRSLACGLFESNDGIRSIEVPDTVSKLGKRLFFNTPSLQSVQLPHSLRYIRPGMFTNAGIESIEIPDGVTMIDRFAFHNSKQLKSVTISDDSSLTYINSWAFAETSIEEISLPDSVVYIGELAFYRTYELQTIEIPKRITQISTRLFMESGLTSVVFHDEITVILPNAFKDTSLTGTLILPKHLQTVSSLAFSNCDVEKVILNSNLITLGNGALSQLSYLSQFDTLSNQRFSSIDGVLVSKDYTKLIQYPLGKTDTSYHVGDHIERIGSYAFSDNDYLEKITMSNSVISIGDGAFSEMSSLKEIQLSDGLVSLPYALFENCDSLINVTFPRYLEYTSGQLFYKCDLIEQLHLPDTLRHLDYWDFMATESFKNLYLPADFELTYSAFSHSNIETIYFNGDVNYEWYDQFFLSSLFEGNDTLESIYIHEDYYQNLYDALLFYHEQDHLNKIKQVSYYSVDDNNIIIYEEQDLDSIVINVHLTDGTIIQVPMTQLMSYEDYIGIKDKEPGIYDVTLQISNQLLELTVTIEEGVLYQINYYDQHDVLIDSTYILEDESLEYPTVEQVIFSFEESNIYVFKGWSETPSTATQDYDLYAEYDVISVEDNFSIEQSILVEKDSVEELPEMNVTYGEFEINYSTDIHTNTIGIYYIDVYVMISDMVIYTDQIKVEVVEYIDTTPPTFDEIDDQTIEVGNPVFDWDELATNKQDDYSETFVVTVDDGVDYNAPGIYQVTITVKDEDGNATSKTFNVTVEDTTPPVITAPEVINYYIGDDLPDYLVQVSAFDSADGEVTYMIMYDDSLVDYENTGEYLIEFEVSDFTGNITSIVVVLSVLESPTFVFELNGESTVTISLGEPYVELGATCVNLAGEVCDYSIEDVEFNEIGTYTIVYQTFTDEGNEVRLERTVIIEDDIPEITLNGVTVVTITEGETYDEFGVTCITSTGETCEVVTDSDELNTDIPGTYTIYYSYLKDGEVVLTISRTVEVLQAEEPNTEEPNTEEPNTREPNSPSNGETGCFSGIAYNTGVLVTTFIGLLSILYFRKLKS